VLSLEAFFFLLRRPAEFEAKTDLTWQPLYTNKAIPVVGLLFNYLAVCALQHA
jgi:hypothetical protein